MPQSRGMSGLGSWSEWVGEQGGGGQGMGRGADSEGELGKGVAFKV